MNLVNLFKIAIKALSNNKMRGFLTMLGIDLIAEPRS